VATNTEWRHEMETRERAVITHLWRDLDPRERWKIAAGVWWRIIALTIVGWSVVGVIVMLAVMAGVQ
jgi:hypothetical protein